MTEMRHLLIALLAMMATASWADVTISYRGTVVDVRDGDSIVISNKQFQGGVTLRADRPIELDAVAAPALDQPGGEDAKRFLVELLKGKTVDVVELTDMGQSRGAWVFLDDQCVNVLLVQYGFAWIRKANVYSRTRGAEKRLEPALVEAKAKKLGIWAQEKPIPPWEWMKEKNDNSANKAPEDTARKLADPQR